MRITPFPQLRFSLRKNTIINDIESRNFLGLWQDNQIVISLPAIYEEFQEAHLKKEEHLINRISDVILHEYLHHELYKVGIGGDHHWCINQIVEP